MASPYTILNLTDGTLPFAYTGGTYYIAADATQVIDLDDPVAQASFASEIAMGHVGTAAPGGDVDAGGATTVDLGTYTWSDKVDYGYGSTIADLGAGTHAGWCTVTLANADSILVSNEGDLYVYLVTGNTPTMDSSWFTAPLDQNATPGTTVTPRDVNHDMARFIATSINPQAFYTALYRYVGLAYFYNAASGSPSADITGTLKLLF